jgi:alpha-D-xyloside xylohydrolase
VYPGANATFTLYEDDNETYAYERGEHATCELRWDDAAKTLHVGARQGTFPGLVAERRLNIVLVGGPNGSASKAVSYQGKTLDVSFR